MALQEVISAPDFAGTEGKKTAENLSSFDEPRPSSLARTYQPQCLFPNDWHGPSYLNLNPDSRDSWRLYVESMSTVPS